MRLGRTSCLAALFMFSATVFGQEQHGSVKLYELRPYLFALENRGSDGQVCKVEIERRHWVEGRPIDLSSTIPLEMVMSLVDELAPSKLRGPLVNPSLDRFGNSTVFGNLVERTTEYQNVKVSVLNDLASSPDTGAKVITIDWKIRGCKS